MTSAEVIRAVCRTFNIPRDRMLGGSRIAPVVFPRQVAMYLCRELLKYSYPQIGRVFLKDHTTAMSGCKTVIERLASDEESRATVDAIVAELNREPVDVEPCPGCRRNKSELAEMRILLRATMNMTEGPAV